MKEELYEILLEAGYIRECDRPSFPGKNYLDSIAGCDILLDATRSGYFVVVDVNRFTNDEAEKCERVLLRAGFVKHGQYISEMDAIPGDDELQIAEYLKNRVRGVRNLLEEFDD